MRKIIILFSIIFVVSCSYKAQIADYQLPEKIIVNDFGNYISIAPECYVMDDALVFYPGGLVSPDSYIPLAADMAKESGIAVFIQKMPFDLAVLGKNRVEKILEKYDYIDNWYIAGHSLGGVMAASWVHDHPGIFKGMIFLASYPTDKDLLKGQDISVLSIRGSEDGLVSEEKINETRTLLPDDSEYLVIQGGNHAQYGEYGAQKGDGIASISGDEQKKAAAAAIASFIRKINHRIAF